MNEEPILKPKFVKIKKSMSLPRRNKKPKTDTQNFKTATSLVVSLLKEGFGDSREIREMTGLNITVLGSIIKRLAPIHYNTNHEMKELVVPKIMYSGFEYRSAELAILPLKKPDIKTLKDEPYFTDVMSKIAEKIGITFEGPCEDPTGVEPTNTWVKFSYGLSLEFKFIEGTWENFAILCGYHHQDTYYPLHTPYQFPAILPVIASKIGTKKGGITIDEIIKLESLERVKEQLSLVIDYLEDDRPHLKVSPYDEVYEDKMPSDWILEGVESKHYFLIENLTKEEFKMLTKEMKDGFSITFSGLEELIDQKEKTND